MTNLHQKISSTALRKIRPTSFLWLYASLVVVSLVSTAAFNYVVDPENIFHSTSRPQQASALISEQSVIFREIPQNERLFQEAYISLNEKGDDVVVFGSSRANQFSSEILQADSTFNHFVSGASIEDYLALSQLLYEARSGLETVVVTVDPWLFNRSNGQGRWIALGEEYNRALRRIGLDHYVVDLAPAAEEEPAIQLSKLTELLSFSYLEASVKEVFEFDLGFGNRVRILREGEESDHRVKRPDGSQVNPVGTRNRSLQAVTADAIEMAHPDTDLYSVRNFGQIDPAFQEIFEAMVADLVQRDIIVELVLIPYHPIVYDAIEEMQKYGTVLDVERYVDSFAKANNLRLRGSYDPVLYECGLGDFLDGLHPKGSCLFNVLTKEPPPPPTIADILGPTATILSLVDPASASNLTPLNAAGAVLTWSKPLSDFDKPPDKQADPPVVTFNGTDEVASSPDSAYWSMLGARSLGGWMRLDTESDDGALMGKYDTRLGAPEWRLRLASGHWELIISDASEEGNPFIKTKIDAAAKVGTWEFVVFTYDGGANASGITAYVDGVLAASTDVDQSGFVLSEDLGADIGFGGYQEGSFFSGTMAAGPLGPFYTQVVLSQKAVSDIFALGFEALEANAP